MNFIELWLVAIQLFNIDSISIDRLYLSPQTTADFKMWAIPTEKEKIINEH